MTIPGQFLATINRRGIETPFGALLGDAPNPDALPALGATAKLVVRPENIRLNDVLENEIAIPGKVSSMLYLGSYSRVQVDSPLGRIQVVRPVAHGGTAAPGDTVSVSWNPADAIVLPNTRAATLTGMAKVA